MEDPPKKSNKSMPAVIKIGAGAGIGGIVLLGGALVTATLVSALAIKTRRHGRSSSDTVKKTSSDEQETPNKLELMMKISKDRESTKHFSDQKPRTHMEELQSKPTQILISDAKQHLELMEVCRDGNEDNNLGEADDQETSCINVDEKIPLEEFEEIPAQTLQLIEEESHTEISLNDEGGKEQKFSVPVDDEYTDTDSKPLISMEVSEEEKEAIEGVCAAVEEKESIRDENAKDITIDATAVQAPLGDDVAEAVEDEEGDGGDEGNMLFVKEEAIEEQVTKAACMHQFEEGDSHDEIIMENSEANSIETAFLDQTVREKNQQMQYTSEQVIEAARVDSVNVEDILDLELMKEDRDNEGDVIVERFEVHHEAILEDAQQFHSSEVHEFITNGDDPPPSQLMNNEEKVNKTGHEVQEEMITEDELIKKGNEDEITHVQLIERDEEAHDDDQIAIREDNPPRQSMNEEEKVKGTAQIVHEEIITEDELIIEKDIKGEEDEIPHVQSTEEAKSWPDVSTHKESTPETKIGDQKIEENMEKNVKIEGEKNREKGMETEMRFMMELSKESKQKDSWKVKLRTWSVLVPMWCLCLFHWYFELPLLKLNLVCSLLSIFILLGIQNPTTYLAKYR